MNVVFVYPIQLPDRKTVVETVGEAEYRRVAGELKLRYPVGLGLLSLRPASEIEIAAMRERESLKGSDVQRMAMGAGRHVEVA